VLTKELLCFRTNRGKIIPKLINPEAAKLLEIAEELIIVFSGSVGDVREKLEQSTKQVLDAFPGNAVVGRGLEKLLLDRTEFDTVAKSELSELREKIFSRSSALLQGKSVVGLQDFKVGTEVGLEEYRNAVAQEIGISVVELRSQLYGDLPHIQQVLGFRKMSAEGLLHRYNCAQIQGLLLRCEAMTILLPDTGAARLRQLLKYLRFNKLLCKISRNRDHEKSLVLEIDGPLSMFVNTQKYGLNLANLFPAILHQPRWELEAEVRIRKNQSHILKLNQICGIRSHYRQFLSYVPEEIELLSLQLAKKISSWELTSSADYLQLTGESVCFPDYLLTHSSGKKVAMELFHTWHAAPLGDRLQQLDSQSHAPLLVGVNRSLLKNEELAEKVESSPYFSRFGFYFREAPTAAKIIPLLDEWLQNVRKLLLEQ
jgi:predicted nuclease of restriction endonuclease-like RecB superfamily